MRCLLCSQAELSSLWVKLYPPNSSSAASPVTAQV